MPLALQQNQSKVRQKLDLEDGNTHASRRVCQKKKKWCTSFIVENPRFPVNWRLLVKECITNFDIPLDVFFGVNAVSMLLGFFFTFLVFWGVLWIQPTVHIGGVIRGRVCSCGCWQGICNTWHFHWLGPLEQVSHRVHQFVCLDVCLHAWCLFPIDFMRPLTTWPLSGLVEP